jgi:ATP-dependent Clp protease adaptor protein ClpS
MAKMSTDTTTKSVTKIAPRLDLPPPGKFQVIFNNDNVTPMDFVIACLTEIFHHGIEEAQHLTLKVHETGSAVVAVLPYEIAEQKAVEVTVLARNNNFPLDVRVKPEN